MNTIKNLALGGIALALAVTAMGDGAEARQIKREQPAPGTVVTRVIDVDEHKNNKLVRGIDNKIKQANKKAAAKIVQKGDDNAAAIGQSGGTNGAYIRQKGKGHTATVSQNGNKNSIGVFQFGKNADVDVSQVGDKSNVIIAQRGY